MGPHRIAIVDDAPEVRALVRARLRLDERFDLVGEAGTGLDAVALAVREQPDLMLLDVSMPGLSGLDVLERVRRESPATQVVLFTGFDEEGLETRARELGAAAFVHKSADLDRLLGVLARVGDGRSVDADSTGPVPARPADHVEPVLAEHVERFRAVFDRAAIGVGILTLTGQVVRANPALAVLLGTTTEGLVGTNLPDVAPPAEQHILGFTVATSVQDGVAQVEHHVQGTERMVLSTIAVVQDSSARPLYLLLQCQDVSAQRKAERALVESEERFRLLVDSVTDYAIFMLDAEGRIASWNRGAERLKGYRAQDVLGRHFRMFYEPHAQQAHHPEHELEVAGHEGRYTEEGWRVRKDGSRFWANVVITALRDPDGGLLGFAKVTRDVTRQHQAARELEESAAQLAAANVSLGAAAEERANLVSITAHELRSPLAVVAGASQTLRRHWDDLTAEEREDLLLSAETGADRMRRMLDDLLLAARLEAGRVSLRPSTVELRRALETTVAAIAPLLAGVAVRVECPDDLRLRTDHDQLMQVVTNYLTNAARYGDGPVAVTAAAEDDAVSVVVEDHGPGVPAAIADELFHEMFLTGDGRRGTGLGLYVVRRLAQTLDGEAWYERADGVTRFGVTVPDLPA